MIAINSLQIGENIVLLYRSSLDRLPDLHTAEHRLTHVLVRHV